MRLSKKLVTINRITTCRTEFTRRTAGYTKWDYERNEVILDKLD